MKISSTLCSCISKVSLGALTLAAVLLSGCSSKPSGSLSYLPSENSAGSAKSGYFTGSLYRSTLPASSEESEVRPISAPAGVEELWIVARSSDPQAPSAEETPGSGELMAKIEEQEVPMPLKHTDVRASVSGYIGSVE